ncbi:MAG: dihydroorotase [Bacteroidales bacterium]|nr:dihydroorotase [Bacteroidales bacterium]
MTELKGIHIIDDLQDAVANLTIEDGIIKSLEYLDVQPDASQPVVMPAFTDLHVHFRDPGLTYKEDVVSGSHAAVRGGYTAVNMMPNTLPVVDTLDKARDVEARVRATGLIHGNQAVSMTIGELGQDCSHLTAIPAGAIPFVSDDGKGVNRDDIMEQIFLICKEKGFLIMAHEEDARYSPADLRMAENMMTFRDLDLCRKTGGSIHFCHVSTREAIEAIREAKREGLAVSCEICPHHIFYNAEQAKHYRVAPPFRTDNDIEALICALQDGTAEVISTDHAPHTPEDKANGANGISGIETAFALCYTKLVRGGHLSLQQLIRLMSTKPSEMMRLNKGRIQEGMQADLVWADLQNPYQIDPASFASRGKNTPFAGVTVYGRILKTLKAGKTVYSE